MTLTAPQGGKPACSWSISPELTNVLPGFPDFSHKTPIKYRKKFYRTSPSFK